MLTLLLTERFFKFSKRYPQHSVEGGGVSVPCQQANVDEQR